MPQLYRSPNVLIDGALWHITVHRCERTHKRAVRFRFRRSAREMWKRIDQWPGRLPKGLREDLLHRYRHSVRAAMASLEYP